MHGPRCNQESGSLFAQHKYLLHLPPPHAPLSVLILGVTEVPNLAHTTTAQRCGSISGWSDHFTVHSKGVWVEHIRHLPRPPPPPPT